MNPQIETIKKVRIFLLEAIKDLTTEQFNKIPAGYNNNIAWNLGHLIAAQQGMCYKRAGVTPHISEEFWEQFRTGSKPEKDLADEDVTRLKSLFLDLTDQLDADYNQHIFGGYVAWMTRYNVEISTIDDALSFLPFHEGLHFGVITTMKKLVQ